MVTLLRPHGLRQLTAAPRSGCRSRHSRGVDRGLLDGRTCYPQLLLALHCKRRCTHKQRAFLKLSFLPAPPQLQPPGPGLQHTSAALTACPAPSHPHSTLHPPWPLRVPLLGGISMLAFRRRGGGGEAALSVGHSPGLCGSRDPLESGREQRDIRSVLTLQSTQYKPYIPYGARRKQRNMPWGSWHPALSWAAQPPDVPMPLAVPRAITAPQCAPSRSHFGKH